MLRDLPEIRGLETRRALIRIPDEQDVPLTPRVRRVIDTPAFRRLARVSQLGMVSLVYPAANHTRFEHSLGVYRMALLYLQQLAHDERFTAVVTSADAELFILAALLHDIGHWPFCHLIEDLRLPGVPTHEEFAAEFLADGELADVVAREWRVEPWRVADLLAKPPADNRQRVLQSMLSGPIDVDKMDYLVRDSLHAGVPYGRNFDRQRLIGSLCLNAAGDGLAIRDKGRTAAEMMVFARYVMFSEVYWHHAVRAAAAMLQRAFCLLAHEHPLATWLGLAEQPLLDRLHAAAGAGPAGELLDGLFGPRRRLYKRLGEYNHFENSEIHARFLGRASSWLTRCAAHAARLLGARLCAEVAPHEVLFDVPPPQREVQFQVEIYYPKEQTHRMLADVSPVVHALARKQFDDHVKRVRVFIHPRHAAAARALPDVIDLWHEAINLTENG